MTEPLTEAMLLENLSTVWSLVGNPMPPKVMMSKSTYKTIKRWMLIFDGVPLRIGKHRVKVRQRNNRWQVIHA